jgi:flagellar biosynthetic protein FliP
MNPRVPQREIFLRALLVAVLYFLAPISFSHAQDETVAEAEVVQVGDAGAGAAEKPSSGDWGWLSNLPKLGPILPEAKHKKKKSHGSSGSASSSTSADDEGGAGGTSQALRIVIGLTLLALMPAILVCLTSFLRIIIVLSMLRHAIGMQETPPNTVLIGLALFLTMFTMSPVLEKMNQEALQPFMGGKMSMQAAYDKGFDPLREFMVRQTREQDLILLIELSKAKPPESMADISNVQLIPAFMLSELRAAFQIGFVIFLPFLLIDLIVSSLLMALGMMMMPPTTIALPLKILMFILIDGWSLILKALVGSFH